MDIWWTIYAIFIYILAVFLLVVIPAALNISLGLRGRYINLLVKIFKVY